MLALFFLRVSNAFVMSLKSQSVNTKWQELIGCEPTHLLIAVSNNVVKESFPDLELRYSGFNITFCIIVKYLFKTLMNGSVETNSLIL